jgi:hypothetical protein
MQIINFFLCSVTGLVLLAACQPWPNSVNHPKPDLSIGFSFFTDAGCPPSEYGFHNCTGDSPLAALGCDAIREPSNLLGGLSPSYPLAICEVHPYSNTAEPGKANAEMIAKGEYFYNAGGIEPVYIRYLIYKDNEFQLIKDENELRKVFLPIETSEEALSYVLAVKNLSAYYGLTRNPKYEYKVDVLEDTHIDMITNGYALYLFYYEAFGCGPHWTYAVETHITIDGTINEVSRKPIFKDPSEDELCID